MRYAVLEGGKRIRPLLAFAAAEAMGMQPAATIPAAVAVELIHAYSLVHDDLPCMDDDVLRRGKPTVHVAFGEATALLVGDALQSLAFEVLSRPDDPMPGRAPRRGDELLEQASGQVSWRSNQVHLLAEASGSRGMAGGQSIDLESVGRPLELAELERMHLAKTGALVRASVLLGASSGSHPGSDLAERRSALERYARAIGLAFQVVDDVLDAEAETGVLGKTAGKDADCNKPTYLSILGPARAKELAESLGVEAGECLAPFGGAAARLRQLADYIIRRKY